MRSKTPPRTVDASSKRTAVTAAIDHDALAALPAAALDDRIAIVGMGGSGKTYAAKGFVERLLSSGARVAIVDPLGVWWGLRASADGSAAGFPVVVFGGKHADVPITAEMGAALGRLSQAVVDAQTSATTHRYKAWRKVKVSHYNHVHHTSVPKMRAQACLQ
jgi:hypothetical protein